MFDKKRDPKVDARLAAMKAVPAAQFNAIEYLGGKIERADQRRAVYKFGLLVTIENQELKCIVRDISPSGAKLQMDGADGLPETFSLIIDGYGAPAKARLIWQEESEAGVAFE